MKKLISVLLTLCMTLSLLGGAIVFESSAANYETVKLVGFDDWTQTELNTSSGNNGYANGCSTALTVVTDKKYIVGGASQAIKAVFGSGSYNNAIVNWTYGTGGPCTDGNVWAADGTTVNVSEYDGIRIAILNSEGKPAEFSRVILRLTHGWNYSGNMRYWEGAPVRDDEGWFYFDFESFNKSGSPEGTDIYDYVQNFAKGISMLNNGGEAENTCYYSTVELYKQAGGVSKVQLSQYISRIKNLDSETYAKEIAAAEAVFNRESATQDQVDEQVAIIASCIADWQNYKFSTYSFAQLKGIQEWTSENAANMNGYGSVYEVSDKGTLGAAKQSIKLTTNKNSRYCFANSAKDGSFFGNPYEFVNAEDGKLSDYDGIAIAFTDENGKPIQFSQFTARLMRNKSDWDNYWVYESIFTDMDVTCLNGYYFIPFSAYSALSGEAVNDLSIMSVLWYKDLASGETAYISDMLAYKEGDVATDANGYAKTPIPGFNSFTTEELSQMAVKNGKLSFEKQGSETVINILETADNGWGSYTVEFATASTAEQSAQNPLINGKSFFGDVELGNKAGIRFKIVNTGAEGTSPFNGEVSLCFGSSHRYIAVDYKGMYPDADGYYTVDWSTLGKKWGQEILWTSWYTDFTEITGAYDKGIDMVKIVFVGKKGEKYSFYIDDIYAYAAGDARELYNTIQTAKGENVSQALIDEAMDVYLDCTATQEEIDAINQKIVDAMDEELIAVKAYKEELDKLLNEAYDNGLDAEYEDLLVAADLIYGSLDSTVEQLRYYVNELREKVTLALVDDAYADILTKAFYAWEYNYTADSWAKFAPLAKAIFPVYDTATAEEYAALEAAYNALVLANTEANDELLFDGWSDEDVNAVVDANTDKLCDSIGKGHNGLFVGNNDWNGGDFTNNTIFEASNGSFSMTALADFIDGSMGWKNMDRSTTLGGVANGAYPLLNVEGLSECDGLRIKIDVEGSADRILIGLSNCADMMEESYALNINPESIGADGYINIPFSYFETAFWANPISNPENAIVFIVEVYGVTEGTTISFSDVRGYKVLNYTIPTLWEYNYTAESWAAYEAAIASVASQEDVDAAVALLVAYPTAAVTGNLFDGWTTDAVNAVVNANSDKLCDSIGEGLNIDGAWNAGDFSNNTTFAADNNFSMTATADFTGKAMGWKNMDRSQTLGGVSNGAYPALNVKGLSEAEGIRFKLDVDGSVERILIGLSNCSTMTREMYALKIKAEYVDADGYINIPFSYFEKAFWCPAFAQNELEDVIVFIVEAYGATEGTTVTISDIHGYVEGVVTIPERWEYNYTADSWAAYKAAIADVKTNADVAAAEALLVARTTSAVTGNLFDGWNTADVNAVVNANSDKLCDSIGEGLNINNAWNAGDFSKNTTFAADNNFSMTATADFTGKAMGWKNMDRSTTLGGVSNGAYPALNVKGLSKADGIRFKLDVDGSVERILIGLSNCSTMTREMYALKIKAEYVDADGYINIPFSYFEAAFWCPAFAQNELEDVIVFIVEAYGATEGTTVTISDIHGYQEGELVIPAVWEYNYTAASFAAYEAAIAAAKSQLDVDAAADLLVAIPTSAVTGNLFEGWNTADVNAVVDANSDKLCDSIGEGLNINNAWNAGDFSKNTTFAADNNFSMTATADFTNKAMGWKNMDRSTTLGGVENGAYPALNVKGLSEAEGIRFKLDVDGSVERILIGLSNCSNMVREMYAIQIKPEYVAADGYINIPFSYFEAAFWCPAFAQNELEDVIVFIVEAYNVTNGTTVTISDIHGYSTKTFGADLAAAAAALASEIEAYDFLGKYAEDVAALKALTAESLFSEANAVYAAIVAKNIVPAYNNIEELAAAIKALDADLEEVKAAIDVYYAPASQDDVDAALLALNKIINTPDAPVIEAIVGIDSVELSLIEGVEYKIEGGEWSAENVFAGLVPGTEYTFYAYYPATANANASEVAKITVTTALGTFADAAVVISGVERYLGTLTAEVIGAPEYLDDITITWYNSGGQIIGNGETLDVTADLIMLSVYAVASSDKAADTVSSRYTGEIGKALITEYTAPTASGIKYPQTLGESVLTGSVNGITGTWAWVTPEIVPNPAAAASYAVVFTPSGEYAKLYEEVYASAVVAVEAPDYTTATLTADGISLTGEFVEGAEIVVESFGRENQAYLALLRAASKNNDGINLVLFKNVDVIVDGEASDNIYNGSLTLSAFYSEARAGETVNVWMFVDGETVCYTGTVDANGYVVVENVIL